MFLQRAALALGGGHDAHRFHGIGPPASYDSSLLHPAPLSAASGSARTHLFDPVKAPTLGLLSAASSIAGDDSPFIWTDGDVGYTRTSGVETPTRLTEREPDTTSFSPAQRSALLSLASHARSFEAIAAALEQQAHVLSRLNDSQARLQMTTSVVSSPSQSVVLNESERPELHHSFYDSDATATVTALADGLPAAEFNDLGDDTGTHTMNTRPVALPPAEPSRATMPMQALPFSLESLRSHRPKLTSLRPLVSVRAPSAIAPNYTTLASTAQPTFISSASNHAQLGVPIVQQNPLKVAAAVPSTPSRQPSPHATAAEAALPSDPIVQHDSSITAASVPRQLPGVPAIQPTLQEQPPGQPAPAGVSALPPPQTVLPSPQTVPSTGVSTLPPPQTVLSAGVSALPPPQTAPPEGIFTPTPQTAPTEGIFTPTPPESISALIPPLAIAAEAPAELPPLAIAAEDHTELPPLAIATEPPTELPTFSIATEVLAASSAIESAAQEAHTQHTRAPRCHSRATTESVALIKLLSELLLSQTSGGGADSDDDDDTTDDDDDADGDDEVEAIFREAILMNSKRGDMDTILRNAGDTILREADDSILRNADNAILRDADAGYDSGSDSWIDTTDDDEDVIPVIAPTEAQLSIAASAPAPLPAMPEVQLHVAEAAPPPTTTEVPATLLAHTTPAPALASSMASSSAVVARPYQYSAAAAVEAQSIAAIDSHHRCVRVATEALRSSHTDPFSRSSFTSTSSSCTDAVSRSAATSFDVDSALQLAWRTLTSVPSANTERVLSSSVPPHSRFDNRRGTSAQLQPASGTVQVEVHPASSPAAPIQLVSGAVRSAPAAAGATMNTRSLAQPVSAVTASRSLSGGADSALTSGTCAAAATTTIFVSGTRSRHSAADVLRPPPRRNAGLALLSSPSPPVTILSPPIHAVDAVRSLSAHAAVRPSSVDNEGSITTTQLLQPRASSVSISPEIPSTYFRTAASARVNPAAAVALAKAITSVTAAQTKSGGVAAFSLAKPGASSLTSTGGSSPSALASGGHDAQAAAAVRPRVVAAAASTVPTSRTLEDFARDISECVRASVCGDSSAGSLSHHALLTAQFAPERGSERLQQHSQMTTDAAEFDPQHLRMIAAVVHASLRELQSLRRLHYIVAVDRSSSNGP